MPSEFIAAAVTGGHEFVAGIVFGGRLSELIVSGRGTESGHADAAELGIERAGGVDCVAGGTGDLCERSGGGIDCGAGDWLYQRDGGRVIENSDVSVDAGHTGIILAGDQCLDAEVRFGAGAGISGARICGGVSGCDFIEFGEYDAEVAGASVWGAALMASA
jgi:hypothetical protein